MNFLRIVELWNFSKNGQVVESMHETFLTDEDYMIQRLSVHRDLVTWLIDQLHKHGIEAKRTRGNDPHGDILVVHSHDIPRAQQLIRTLQEQTRAEGGIH